MEKDRTLDPAYIDPQCFSDLNAEVIQKRFCEPNSFGHYLLLLLLTMKFFFYGKDSKTMFMRVFCDLEKPSV